MYGVIGVAGVDQFGVDRPGVVILRPPHLGHLGVSGLSGTAFEWRVFAILLLRPFLRG